MGERAYGPRPGVAKNLRAIEPRPVDDFHQLELLGW